VSELQQGLLVAAVTIAVLLTGAPVAFALGIVAMGFLVWSEGLHALGFDTGASETPITPVITGDEEKTQTLGRRLFDEGVFCPAIVFPTVARGRARVRTIVTADHTEDDLREALEAFERVGRELSLR